MKYHGVLFDLDGVICSTDEFHYLAWGQVAKSIGVAFDRTINNQLRGVSRMESLEIILRNSSASYTQEEKVRLADEKNEVYKKLLGKMTPTDLDPRVKQTLDRLREKGYKLAIGSSSKNTPFILQRLGLGDFFDAVSDGNNITYSKPNPEVFLKAADMLNLPPKDCLVVEDALAGVQAGRAGGFSVACVGNAAAEAAGD